MTQHTPGPWRAIWTNSFYTSSPDGLHINGSEQYIEEIANGTRVASPQIYSRTDAEITANARLIAAAPELLKALKSLLRRFEGAMSSNNSPELKTLQDAHAVIAKATK